MQLFVSVLIGLIALFHFYFMYLEMFAWTTKAPKVFRGFPKDLFPKTKAMAANQGLYNGFLAAGLVWTFFIEDDIWWFNIALFFLSCVLIAGIYGAISVSKKIFFVQGMPALVAILLLIASKFS
ncbi:MAG: DUF1304 domain-containing protein [Marinirhabdus sp.]|nr:DUF1304 domain-containing protein [Marinirhabdus sp.]